MHFTVNGGFYWPDVHIMLGFFFDITTSFLQLLNKHARHPSLGGVDSNLGEQALTSLSIITNVTNATAALGLLMSVNKVTHKEQHFQASCTLH